MVYLAIVVQLYRKRQDASSMCSVLYKNALTRTQRFFAFVQLQLLHLHVERTGHKFAEFSPHYSATIALFFPVLVLS